MKLRLFLFIILVISCNRRKYPTTLVFAVQETLPVHSADHLDAADDPAIWIHSKDVSKSLVIGTDKKAGLGVYNLKGEEVDFIECGEPNNVDVRYDFALTDSTRCDLIATSERIENTILLFQVDSTGILSALGDPILTGLPEIYGLTMHKDLDSNKYFVFVNDKNGTIQQWDIQYVESQVLAQKSTEFKVATQPEGMVADDWHKRLFVGEETRGIWVFDLSNRRIVDPQFIPGSDALRNEDLSFDIEGLTIYDTGEGNGYLIASAQGNNAYAVFDRNPPYNYFGCFGIGLGEFDDTEDTDGIDVTNVALDERFPDGMFVAQDGKNMDGEVHRPQNFKFVSWRDVASALHLPK